MKFNFFQEITKIFYVLLVLPFFLGIIARLIASVYLSGFRLFGFPL